MLYRLSYRGMASEAGIEPASLAFQASAKTIISYSDTRHRHPPFHRARRQFAMLPLTVSSCQGECDPSPASPANRWGDRRELNPRILIHNQALYH